MSFGPQETTCSGNSLKKGYCELDALEYANSVKDTNTAGEMVGLPLVTALPAPKYSEPLLVSCDGPLVQTTFAGALADLSIRGRRI